jgi:dihydrofolate reductase
MQPQDIKWNNTRVISDLEEIREPKEQTGKDIHVVGGATLISSMINAGLVDEIRLMVNPVLLGGGRRCYHLKLVSAEQRDPGKVDLIYSAKSQ